MELFSSSKVNMTGDALAEVDNIQSTTTAEVLGEANEIQKVSNIHVIKTFLTTQLTI